MSEIITTLIIILVSLVAIMAVWIVVRNVVDSGSQEISLGKFTINLEIQKVVINPTTLDVVVKRDVGSGTIKSFNFIVSNGASSQTFPMVNPGLDELGTRTFSLPYTGIVKQISILPVLDSGASGNPVTKTYTDAEMLQNLGLVSWWRFEGNPNDAVGGNNGAWVGTPGYVNGKFGNAANFSGASYINVSDNPSGSLDPQNGITIAAWVNEIDFGADRPIVVKTPLESGIYPGYQFSFGFNVDMFIRIANNQLQFNYYDPEVWKQTVATYNGTVKCIYVNGAGSCSANVYSPIGDSPDPLWIGHSNRYIGANGVGSFFRGSMDEVMIFNQALTAMQVQGLYNYTFS